MAGPFLRVDLNLKRGEIAESMRLLRERLPPEVLEKIQQIQLIEQLSGIEKPIKMGFYMRPGAEGTVEKIGPADEDGVLLTVRANAGAPDKLLALYRDIRSGEIEPVRDARDD